MAEWLSYSISDFLLFSPRTYYRLFEIYNRESWPTQILAMALGIAIVMLLHSGSPMRTRIVLVILGLLWLWVAWAFHFRRYATINWAAIYVAAAFAFEAVALLAMAFLGRVPLKPIHGVEAKCGQILFLCALFGYPLLPYLTGRDWRQAEFFGLAPDPTAIGTLGLLLIAGGRIRLALMLIPFLWCVITALTLHELGAAYGWIVHVITLSTGVLIVFGQIGEFNQV